MTQLPREILASDWTIWPSPSSGARSRASGTRSRWSSPLGRHASLLRTLRGSLMSHEVTIRQSGWPRWAAYACFRANLRFYILDFNTD